MAEPELDIEAVRRVEQIEGAAWADLQTASPAEFRDRLGVRVWRRYGGVALIASRSDTPAINRALGFGFDEPFTPALLDELIGCYRAEGCRRFILQWSPCAAPASTPRELEARGFVQGPPMAKMVADLRSPQRGTVPWNPALHVEEVGPADRDTFERIVAEPLRVPAGLEPGISSTMGLPGWRHYFALDGDRPVAAAAMYVQDEHAWLGIGATVAADRCRGAQSALLARRLGDAARLGCHWASADTIAQTAELPNPSFRNMHRAGMRLLYERPNHLLALR